MEFSAHCKIYFIFSIIVLWFILPFSFVWSSTTFAQDNTAFIRKVRSIETDELGIFNPAGLSYSIRANTFYVLPEVEGNKPSVADIFLLTPTEDLDGSVRITAEIKDLINLTFDNKANRLLIFKSATKHLIEIMVGADGNLYPSTMTYHNAAHFGIKNPQGMTVDPESGHLFILDATGPRIVRIDPGPDGVFDKATISELNLQLTGLIKPRGLAFDNTTGHLHFLSFDQQILYEINNAGQIVAKRDLSEFGLNNPQGIVFAPSGDLTDDPSQLSLYLSDDGLSIPGAKASKLATTGQIMELSLTEAVASEASRGIEALDSAVSMVQGSLVQVIDTSQFLPPSPDPAGIAYISSSGTLLISDSEVNEMPIFTNDNLFEMTLSGNLLDTLTTISFSDEPTGVAYNSNNGHLFFSDDNGRRIFEVDTGSDGFYGTSDDNITYFSTSAFNSTDPEGLAYDNQQGVLFIADGLNNEVYRVEPGANGIFDGVPPSGDDQVSSFDTAGLGVMDPEGITFDSNNSHLYIIGEPNDFLAQITNTGTLLRMIDISAVNALMPAGLAYAPSSVNPSEMNIYISDRGVDNNSDPDENDGKVYEISFSPVSQGNTPPTVDAGPDQFISLSDSVILDGTVTDDGLPNPPGVVSTNWSQESGPGTVTFLDVGVVDTTVSFSIAGIYILRLTADDGELQTIDEVTFVVTGDNGVEVIDIRVSASSDDAEESASGYVGRTSSDLELVYDGSDQTVGIRFNGVGVPREAKVLNAYVQFQVDEKNSEATSLTIKGEDIDNAETFASTYDNISLRPTTIADVSWSPDPWSIVGEVGVDQRTPNIASIIQEIVDRPAWTSGNSLAIIITGTGERTAESYDGDINGAPLLRVEYVTGVINNPPLANDDSAGILEDNPVTIDVSANDNDPDGDLDPTSANTDCTICSEPSKGTLFNNGDGSFDYTPADDFNGTDGFVYEICDTESACDTAQVSITVTAVDDGVPVAADDLAAATTPEDVPVTTIDVLLNDTLLDHAAISAFDNTSLNGGTVVHNGDGTFTYTPALDFSGTDSFTYTLTDDEAETATATVTVTVTAVDDGTPVAIADAFTTDEDTVLNGNVLDDNGSGADTLGDPPNTVNLVTDVSNGTLTLNPDGTFTYTPDAEFNGSDSFTYHITDDDPETSNTAQVSITVTAVDDGVPVAADDLAAATTPEDVPVTTIDVLLNDTLLDHAAISAFDNTSLNGGTVVHNGDGTFTYTPALDFSGTDSFTYTLTDDEAETATATVTVTVTAVDDGTPVAIADAFTTDEDTVLNGNVLDDNGSGADTLGDPPNTVNLVTDVSNGTLTLNPDGTFTYTPDAEFNGSDSFTYHITDDDPETSNTAQVSITVTAVDDGVPVAADDLAAATTPEDVPVTTIDVLLNDTLLDHAAISAFDNTSLNGGTVVHNGDGTFTYTPALDFSGTDSFTYTLTDDEAETATATVTVTVTAVDDGTPVAIADAFTTDEDTVLNGNVLDDNGSGADTLGDPPNTVNLVTDVSNGTLTLNPDGTFTYTPDAEFNGSDSFTYHITDDDPETSNTAQVSITVTAVDDGVPVAADDLAAATTPEDVPVTTIDVLLNDTLLDHAAISAFDNTSLNGGTVVHNGDGTFTYTPALDFSGTDSFTYTLTDDEAETATATVTVTVTAVDDGTPVAIADAFTTDEDTVLNGNVLDDNGSGADTLGDPPNTVNLVTDVSNGTLTLNPDGTFTYTPDAEFNGSDSFTYHITDDDPETSNTAQVSITVTAVDDGVPVAADDLAAATTPEDVPVTTIDVLLNDTLLDHAAISAFDNTSLNGGTVVHNGDGTFTYTPALDFSGTDSFTYTLTDDEAETATATVTVTVTAVDDGTPVAIADAFTTDEDTVLNGNVLDDNGSGADTLGDPPNTVNLVTDVSNGTLTLNPDGTFTYTPDAEFNGSDSFTYHITDDDPETSNTAQVSITVTAVDDGVPVAADDLAAATTPEDVPVTTIDVLLNDTLLDHAAISAFDNTSLNGGTVVHNGDGTFTYTPALDFSGTDSFTYTLTDDEAETATATVTVTVTAVDDGTPVAIADAFTTDEDTVLNGNVLDDNGSGADTLGDPPNTVNLVTDVSNGTLTLNPDGTFTYTPDAEFNGSDSFTYHITDDDPETSNTAQVSITVTAVDKIHIGDIDANSYSSGKKKWKVTVIITVHDSKHDTVANAEISGIWSGGTSRTDVCITDINGHCSIISPSIWNSDELVVFTVENVSHAIMSYDQSINHDPDGDSNGTVVTVNRP